MLDIVDLMDIIVGKSLFLIDKAYKVCKCLSIKLINQHKKERKEKKDIDSKYLKCKVKILNEKSFNKIKAKHQIHSTNSEIVIYNGSFTKKYKKRNNNKEDEN